jgi:hypothetical protein
VLTYKSDGDFKNLWCYVLSKMLRIRVHEIFCKLFVVDLTVTYVERKNGNYVCLEKNKTFGAKETLNKQPISIEQKEELRVLCKSRFINNWHVYV